MILGAVLALLLYALVDVLRARRRYLEWQKFWSPERQKLHALRHMSPQPTDSRPLG